MNLITPSTISLSPGVLWPTMRMQTTRALAHGVLRPIDATYALVEQEGIPFIIWQSSQLALKEAAKRRQERATAVVQRPFNPFLPYDPSLFVSDISATHLCLLNKYNLMPHHLVIVTRAFELQESWLTLADLTALWVCMAQVDGLGFYNGGPLAGASQAHKHLQLLPYPLIPNGPDIPIGPAVEAATYDGLVGMVPQFNFAHAVARLDPDWLAEPETTAVYLYERYCRLLAALGVPLSAIAPGNKQSLAYNFLVTRDWMLVVPRWRSGFDSVSINSLGFAGSLLVRNAQTQNNLRHQGPLTALQQVTLPL